jgi:hypothetical protein
MMQVHSPIRLRTKTNLVNVQMSKASFRETDKDSKDLSFHLERGYIHV